MWKGGSLLPMHGVYRYYLSILPVGQGVAAEQERCWVAPGGNRWSVGLSFRLGDPCSLPSVSLLLLLSGVSSCWPLRRRSLPTFSATLRRRLLPALKAGV